MLPSPEDLADPEVPAVAVREAVVAVEDEVEREEVTVVDLLVVDMDVDEVETEDSEVEDVAEEEREELPEEFLEECVEVVVEVVRVQPLHSNSKQKLTRYLVVIWCFLVF